MRGQLKKWLKDTEPKVSKMCSEPIGAEPRVVEDQLNRAKAYVTGDIGCYTLGFLPPLSAMDTCVFPDLLKSC